VSNLERIKKIIAKQLDINPSELTETTNLQEAGFESLDVIEMIFGLEDEFKIDIPFNANEADPSEMKTVGDIVRMVETRLAGGSLSKTGAATATGNPTDGAPP
jgi:acyl carrier protein